VTKANKQRARAASRRRRRGQEAVARSRVVVTCASSMRVNASGDAAHSIACVVRQQRVMVASAHALQGGAERGGGGGQGAGG